MVQYFPLKCGGVKRTQVKYKYAQKCTHVQFLAKSSLPPLLLSICSKFKHIVINTRYLRQSMFHLIPLQLKEVVEIVGVQGRAQVRRCGSLAEVEIRVGRVGLWSERVKGAGLVGVL